MSDIAITAGNFLPSSQATYETVIAGAALTRGQPYYKDTADSRKAKLCDADAAASARVSGIAAADVATGQQFLGVTRDPALKIGGTLTKGGIYCVSTGAGGVCPIADLASGDYLTVLGPAISTTELYFDPIITEVAL